MADKNKFFSLGLLLAMSMIPFTVHANARFIWKPMTIHAGGNLAARLKVDGESPNCWDSLFHLQACSGELVMFFMNGETYLGPSCCRAIRIVGNDCWPGMLQSLGFTDQEGDLLQGYCDNEDEEEAHSPPASPASKPTN